MKPARPVYTIAQLAEYLGRSEHFIRDEIRDGNLRARRQRSLTVITADDLCDYLEGLAVVAPELAPADAAPPPSRTPVRRGRQRVVRLLDIEARPAADADREAAL